VNSATLEQVLRNFDRVATLVRARAAKQVWRFEFGGKTYYLHFHLPIRGLRRLFRPTPFISQFFNLVKVQRLDVPSPRVVAQLSGFRLRGEVGDAVIVEGIDNAQQLDHFLNEQRLKGLTIANRRQIARQVVELVERIGRAKFGHRKLGMECFLVADGKVYLHDVQDLRGGGLRLKDVLKLGHSAARFATRTELLRGWNSLNPDVPMLRHNPVTPSQWRELVRRCRRENDDFGVLRGGRWGGHFVKSERFAVPWSIASRHQVSQKDWETAWPTLMAQIQSEQLEIAKRDPSGEIFSGEVVLGGRPIPVFIKRPRRRFLYRYIVDVFRPARAMRTWTKAWKLIARELPCEFPLLIMSRRTLGYTTDSLIVFERVPGTMLDRVDLDQLPPPQRDMLFRRAGHILRALERAGLAHYDSKSVNWIVFNDPLLGPLPVMIDLDGIRRLTSGLVTWGIHRLLRAMKQHPQYTPADSLALCQGYAPHAAAIVPEDTAEPT
jgi:tRNA A-37 threonylcarbamoyl transferase component Bud32